MNKKISQLKNKIIFYNEINFFIIPSVLLNFLLKREIYVFNIPFHKYEKKIFNFFINILKIKQSNFLNNDVSAYTKSFDVKFNHLEDYFSNNINCKFLFELLSQKFKLDELGKKKFEVLIKNQLYKNNIDKDYASILLIENISKNRILKYYPSHLSTYLLLKHQKTYQVSKLLIIINNIKNLFNILKKIKIKFTVNKIKNYNLPLDSKCEIGFVPHKNFTYQNSFKKNYIFDTDIDSPFHKSNILNIFFHNLDNKTLRYININKLNFKILKLSKKNILINFIKNLMFCIKILFVSRKDLILSFFFINIFYKILISSDQVKKNLNIKKIIFHYDVLVSPFFNLALHINSITTFAIQERTMQYLYFKFYFFDHYFVVNKDFTDKLSKSGYLIGNYINNGFPRCNYGSYLIDKREYTNKFNLYDNNYLFIGLTCFDDERIASYADGGTSINSNLKFLNLIDEVSDKYISTGIHITYKNYAFLKTSNFQNIYFKLKAKDNIFFYEDNKSLNAYILCHYSDLIISKYSSIVDEMLSIGKKVLIYDSENYVSNFNYYLSNEPICINSKNSILEKIGNFEKIDFQKYENLFESKYSYQNYYNHVKTYINRI